MKTIISRDNGITKLAPNKVTKKDVPRFVSLSSETTFSQKPRFFVGDFVRIIKKDKVFRKGYEQSYSDEVFEITNIPKLIPSSHSLIYANTEQIEGTFFQSDLQLVRELEEENE